MTLYLYMTRRNKKGFKLLTTFKGTNCPQPLRVDNIKSLGLPTTTEQELSVIVAEHKMDWEVWVQSTETFQELKNSLNKRGYKVGNSYITPLYNHIYNYVVSESTKEIKPNTKVIQQDKIKTMVQRKN